MFKAIMSLFSRRKIIVPPDRVNDTETILECIDRLKKVDKDTSFSPRKASVIFMEVYTEDIEELEVCLIEAAEVVSKGKYIPSVWGKTPRVLERTTLSEYIDDGEALIHPIDWLVIHEYRIRKLITSINKLDLADKEYYLRKCNFIIEDLAALSVSTINSLKG